MMRLEEPSTFHTLAARLTEEYGAALYDVLYDSRKRFSWLCVCNKKRVLPDESLKDGDEVILLPPLAGG